MDGNPLDICSIVSYLALQKLRIPKTELTIGKGQLSQVLQDFEVISDISQSILYDFSYSPLIITVSKVIFLYFLFLSYRLCERIDWKITSGRCNE
jgi:exosome complex RNA-binding protein Rrp42 (RNase PH superfamily)